MANRYWVGGTGSWTASNTANWSATSGGAGGASVPTLADDVFFNSASNATAYTMTLTSSPVCRNVSVSGPASGNVTVAGNGTWSIYGSLIIAATGVTWTSTYTLIFAATTTGFFITTNGVALASAIILNGAGGGWTLGSALTNTGSFTLSQGAFNTSNFNLTLNGNFNNTGALTRSLTLGSSSITCLLYTAAAATNLTVNAGTSTITVTNAAGTFFGAGLTYYNVFKANNGFAIGDANNTFNALTNNSVSSTGAFACQFAGNQTIGTLTVNGGATPNGRAAIQTTAALAGTQITLTVGTFVTNGYIDFRDIDFAGAASPLTVATGGDAGNNTNITLATPKTVYWSLAAGGQWRDNGWATTSGGSRNAANYPLPQDTAIIDDVGLNSGATITTGNNPAMGNLDLSTRTLPVTIAFGTNTASPIYGNLTLSSAVTITSTTAVLYFYGFNKTQTITSSGAIIDVSLQVNNLTTTVVLADALTIGSTKTTALSLGTLNLNGNTLTTGLFNSNNTNTRTLAFGTGQINLTGNAGTIWNFNNANNLSITGSATVNATYSGSTGTRGIAGYGVGTALINLNVTAGSDIVNMANGGFRNVNFTGFSGSVITAVAASGDITLGAGMTITSASAWQMYGASGVQQITSNGVTLDAPLTLGGNGEKVLQDDLTIGSTRQLTLNGGTVNLNGKTLTTGTMTNPGLGTKSIAFNSGTLVVTGSTFTYTGANLTISGSGTISMTSASSKTFAGGGISYPTLNQGGAGALTITGANTFADITNSVTPATITFPASAITRVANFNVNGTAGNLMTINSSSSGVQGTLTYTGTGTVSVGYLSIKDLNSTPSPNWYAGTTSANVSNNAGWIFTAPPAAAINGLFFGVPF